MENEQAGHIKYWENEAEGDEKFFWDNICDNEWGALNPRTSVCPSPSLLPIFPLPPPHGYGSV